MIAPRLDSGIHAKGARRSRELALILMAASALGARVLHAQDEVRAESIEQALEPSVVTGRVVDQNGLPVSGAAVVTSAGGRSVTGEDGSFEIAFTLPAGATTVQVTAVANGSPSSRVGSRQVAEVVPGRTVRAGEIQLTSSSTCQPQWLPTFGPQPGLDDAVDAMGVFDDGSGPALYVGGRFTTAGGVSANHVAKWDGTAWSALGTGMNHNVYALAVHDDGGGPALYAGGRFTTADGSSANHIAKWNGSAWSAVGSGMDDTVWALDTHDDGSGPALFAGGEFTQAGGVSASHIAKWNGAWSAVGGGMDSHVMTFAVFDDGGGPALHAAGYFTVAGMVGANRIAKWDGMAWSALGSGVNTPISTLAVYDDGAGPALYVGGGFTTAGGLSANRIAKWSGTVWSTLGSGVNSNVIDLIVHDDGGGPELYATGQFGTAGGISVGGIAKWDGTAWSALGGTSAQLHVGPFALSSYDDGSGLALYVGGVLQTAGGVTVRNIARWNGAAWSTVDGSGTDGTVNALISHDDGSGPALFAAGVFTTIGGQPANRIAKWNGVNWSPLGSGMDGSVLALAVHDDGGGPALYAGGMFTMAGGVTAHRIAKWNGTSWSPLGTGMSNGFSVDALVSHDDGSGPALYAGGSFSGAGGVTASRIARWNGTTWSALGNGASGSVLALAVYDDGSGPALFAGGTFTSAGVGNANNIAKWDGSAWTGLGTGTNLYVWSLAAHDDGSGPALYAGGAFMTAGGVSVNGIGRWNGTAWSSLGGGVSHSVMGLGVHDDGSGPALYAGGFFTTAGGVAANYIARWDGTAWSALGSGMSHTVKALTTYDDGACGGSVLIAGGDFGSAFDSGDSFLAQWGCSPQLQDADGDGIPDCADVMVSSCFPGNGGVIACPCGQPANATGGCANFGAGSTSGAVLDASGVASVGADTLVLTTSNHRSPAQGVLNVFFGYKPGSATPTTGIPSGAGVRCIGSAGSLKRLYTIQVFGGAGSRPSLGDPSISARSASFAGHAIVPPETRHYFNVYRDDQASGPCGSTAISTNLTNMGSVLWSP